MKLLTLTSLINTKLAGELLSYNELKPYLDNVVDDINAQLNSIFPAFSELESFTLDYTAIPDRYLRMVVVPGAAWYYYVADEEGAATAAQYQFDYSRNMFLMLRDYLQQVPSEYQADSLQGSLTFPCELVTGVAGIEIDQFEGVD